MKQFLTTTFTRTLVIASVGNLQLNLENASSYSCTNTTLARKLTYKLAFMSTTIIL